MALLLMNDSQFHCCICLDVFDNPVTLSCGHNFCHTCINRYWDSAVVSQCPLCKRAFFIRPEVSTNTIMKDLVEEFKRMRGPSCDASQPGEVVSDRCRKDGQAKLCALKSSLNSSARVEFYQKMPGFQKQAFTEPLKNPEHMTKKHQPPREIFSVDDNICVCKRGLEGEDKTRNMLLLDEEGNLKKSPPSCRNVCLSENRNSEKGGPDSHYVTHKLPPPSPSQSSRTPYPLSFPTPMQNFPCAPAPGFTYMMHDPLSLSPPMPMPGMPPFGMPSYPYPPPHPYPYPHPHPHPHPHSTIPHSPIQEYRPHWSP